MLHSYAEAKKNLKRDLKLLKTETDELKINFLLTSIACWKIAMEVA